MSRWDRFEDARSSTRAELTYEANSKSMLIAYLLWFFLGTFGVHRMYLDRWFSGLVMLGLNTIGWATTWMLGLGFIPLAFVGIWWVLDALLTFMMTESYNSRLARQLT